VIESLFCAVNAYRLDIGALRLQLDKLTGSVVAQPRLATAKVSTSHLVGALAAALLISAPAVAQESNKPAATKAAQALPIPPPEVLLLMIRTNIIAIDQANKTNNYTVLRALAGPDLQGLTPEQLSEKFADIRAKAIDLSPTIVVSPQLTQSPAITPKGVLHLVGFFPTQPLQVRFHMAFQPVNGFWRLAGFSLDVVPPNAPKAAAAAADKKKTTKKQESGKK